jgi:hypothetical protein
MTDRFCWDHAAPHAAVAVRRFFAQHAGGFSVAVMRRFIMKVAEAGLDIETISAEAGVSIAATLEPEIGDIDIRVMLDGVIRRNVQ